MKNESIENHGSTNAILTALIANALIALSKFIVAFITGSATMKAEAIHSTADCANQVILLVGMKRSMKKPDEYHAFGYGKEIHFWSLIVAMILFSLGAVFSIVEGTHKIMHPEAVEHVYWIFGLLIVAFALEFKSFLVATKELKADNDDVTDSLSLKKIVEQSNKPSLVVVAVEDASALFGLGLALLFTVLAVFVNPIFDGIGSVIIGLLLGYMSFFLTNEIRKMIIGENIDRNTRKEIRYILWKHNMVVSINNIRGMWNSEDSFLLAISIDIDNNIRSGDVEHHVAQLKKNIKKQFTEADPIYIECISQRDSGN